MQDWWNKREENEVAWRVRVGDLKDGFDLDVKNPNLEEEEHDLTSAEVIESLEKSLKRVKKILSNLRDEIL